MDRPLNGKRESFARNNSICPPPEETLLNAVLENDDESIKHIVKTNPKLVKAETRIDVGTDLNYRKADEWQALHIAASRFNSAILRTVVDNLRNPGDINILEKGSNALHVLIRCGENDSLEQFVECAKILVQKGINVNQGDQNDISPILCAAEKEFKNIIKVILEYSDIPVDIDSHKSRWTRDTARDIIMKNKLYDGVLPEKKDSQDESDSSVMFRYLYSKNKDGFLNFKNGEIGHLVNAENGYSTLLQVSCDKRLKWAAEHLIGKGAYPNSITTKNGKTPIEISADNGCYEIFQILLKHPNIQVPKTVLCVLLKNIDNEEFPGISHRKCYDILLDNHRDHINDTDESHNSPLHYAVRYSEPEKVEKLLQLGASLGSKNKSGTMPIQDIEPEVLEKHLNNCIEFDVKDKKFEKENFSVTFNYHTLIPLSKKIEYNVAFENSNPEMNFNRVIERELVAETEVISYMSKAPEFRHLLKHPVIVSFLFVKWHRIRWLFYANLAFYIAFFLSLVVYIFVWYVNFSNAENSSFENFITNLSFGIFLVTYVILIFRELFQMTVSPKKHFRNFHNYFQIILIFFTGSILFIGNPAEDTRRILSSVSIFLAAFELILMVGHHPKLSTNVVMLKTVFFNFFKFLMWYSLLIIAFALSSYILFSQAGVATKNNTKSNDGEDSFTDPGKSVLKTIVMLTGEFDANSLNFQHFPITSKVLFIAAITLLNLLAGLAMSDTQQIKNNAELVGHIARAQHIRYVESMLLGNILPSNVLKKINYLCYCFPESSNRKFRIPKRLKKQACLFSHYLDYKLDVYLNRRGKIHLEKKETLFRRNCIGSYAFIYLDKETIKRTRGIIKKKRQALKVTNEGNKLHKIENASDDRKEIHELVMKLDDIVRYMINKFDSL